MFGSIRRYRLRSGDMDALLHRVDVDFADTMQDVEGFCSYHLFDCGDGEVVAINVFRDREGCEEADRLAAEWVRDSLSKEFDITRIETLMGELAVSRAESQVLEPAHH